MKTYTLPSRFQLGDSVKIQFQDFNVAKAEVIKIHFTQDKVFYDLEVEFNETSAHTRIYNIDAAIVEEYKEVVFGYPEGDDRISIN